jgi:hypothetical protein
MGDNSLRKGREGWIDVEDEMVEITGVQARVQTRLAFLGSAMTPAKKSDAEPSARSKIENTLCNIYVSIKHLQSYCSNLHIVENDVSSLFFTPQLPA